MSNVTPNQASTLFDQLITPGSECNKPASEDELALPDSPEDDASDDGDFSHGNREASEQLAPEAKRAMIRLMRHGVVTAKSNTAVFNILCRHEPLIQNHLADMYLKMMLDPQAGIALLQEQEATDLDSDEEEPVSLISRRTLNLYDTLLLLVLRKYYQERESAGEQQIVIDLDHVESLLTPFLPLTNNSRSDRRNLNGALDKMKERKIIAGSKDNERFEITPVIRYVVNADFLQEMLDSYLTMAGKTSAEKTKTTELIQAPQQDVDHE